MGLGPPVHFPRSCEVGKTRSKNSVRSWQSHENRQTNSRVNLGVCIMQDKEPSQGLVVGGDSYWPMETVRSRSMQVLMNESVQQVKVFVEELWTHTVCPAAIMQQLYQRLCLQSGASHAVHLDWLLRSNLKLDWSFQHLGRVSEDLTRSSGDIKSRNQRYLSAYFAGPVFFCDSKLLPSPELRSEWSDTRLSEKHAMAGNW